MRLRALLVGVGIVAGLFAPLNSIGQVPDHGHDDFWINNGNYKSASGTHCCGPNDCHGPDEGLHVESITNLGDAGYVVSFTYNGNRFENLPVPVASSHDSEDGMAWICGTYLSWNDTYRIRCLFLPTLG